MISENIIYDYIIVGGGIGGLYANYKLSNKGYNGLLLEKNNNFGGRVFEMNFHGSLIKLGAGIMADHNTNLLALLKKLNIKVNSFKSTVETNMKIFDMADSICKIKNTYEKHKKIIKNKGYTVKEFLIQYFGSNFTKNFILNCEYHDFVNSDVEYFIKYYDINDMTHEPYNVLMIKWLDLINKLVKNNCHSNITVLNVTKNNNTFNVITKENTYQCKKIIFATTLKPLIKLSKNIIKLNYKKYIGTVPFVRIYCYYKNGYTDNLSHYTIVDNKLQKVITINDKLLMASYSDSSNALYWKKIKTLSKEKQIKIVTKYLAELNIKGTINDILIAFWDEGVHYYKPTKDLHKTIKNLSKPAKNVYVVGEMVSYKQGWVEGAVLSVDMNL
jgi:hypothetical protein